MLDGNDIKKLIEAQKEVFVTKEEFEGFMEITAKKSDLTNLEKRFDGLENKIEKRFDKIDAKLNEVVNLKHRVEYIENTLNIQPLKS